MRSYQHKPQYFFDEITDDWMCVYNVYVAAIFIILTGWINVDHDVAQEFLSVDIQQMDFFNVGWEGIGLFLYHLYLQILVIIHT